jgi:prephenate dehydrogenase
VKKTAAIVGVGLMGGSLGMALRRRGWHVTGIGRNASRLKKARSLGALDDFTTDIAAGVRSADVLVLATPVGDIVPLAKKAWPHLKPGTLVTDAGSVKGAIVKALSGRTLKGSPVFVGAHPMCGSEKTGVENSRADLYQGASCVLTPAVHTPPAALARAEAFWKGVGAKVVRLSPQLHDGTVAVVSHLPHLIAETLVLTAASKGRPAADLAAGSFKDATRVAGADPVLWSQIFAMNRPALKTAAAVFTKTFRQLLNDGPSAAGLTRVKRAHYTFMRGNSK